MTDSEIQELKRRARLEVGPDGRKLRHGLALDQIAKTRGFTNWGALLRSHRESLEEQHRLIQKLKDKPIPRV